MSLRPEKQKTGEEWLKSNSRSRLLAQVHTQVHSVFTIWEASGQKWNEGGQDALCPSKLWAWIIERKQCFPFICIIEWNLSHSFMAKVCQKHCLQQIDVVIGHFVTQCAGCPCSVRLFMTIAPIAPWLWQCQLRKRLPEAQQCYMTSPIHTFVVNLFLSGSHQNTWHLTPARVDHISCFQGLLIDLPRIIEPIGTGANCLWLLAVIGGKRWR